MAAAASMSNDGNILASKVETVAALAARRILFGLLEQ